VPPISISTLPIQGIRIQPHAPDNTNIKDLALTPAGQKILTPKAATLTKADLIKLHDDEAGEMKLLNLTVQDVNSIKQAFSGPNNLAISSSVTSTATPGVKSDLSVTVASCCTPCCCAAAVPLEVAVQ
jgi:hypothetical protein